MRWSLPFILPALLLITPTRAGEDFLPIPPAVWAIKAGPKGAVVLEDRIRFAVTSIDYVYRVRIFSEAGRGAAEIADLPGEAFRIKGRTSYPDGRQILFNSRKDFAERRFESGSEEQKSTHLIAPGVTNDCVVEFSWSEPANGVVGGLPRRFTNGQFGSWVLANPYPTQIMAIEVGRPFPLAWSLNPGAGAPPESSDVSGYRRLIFHDVPVRETPPYSIRPTLRLPTVVMFWQPEDLRGSARGGPDTYWADAGKSYLRREYDEFLEKGGAYKALSRELTEKLPSKPIQAATELLSRLDSRIVNLSYATFAEAGALPKAFWEDFNARDLNKAAKTGMTNSYGLRLLYFHLLRDAGLTPKLAFVPNRNITIFNWGVMNLWQFDKHLIGIEEPGVGTIWLDPTLRFATPGVVPPDFTGVPALFLDSKNWKASSGQIGGLVSTVNAKQYDYTLDLTEEGESFTVKASFGGYPEFLERARYMALESSEQSRLLKEKFEKGLKNVQVASAEVRNSSNAKANLIWEVKGSLEQESGRNRSVDPFPGMPWPLWVPSELEEVRSAPIVLPYLSAQVAMSTFNIPKGFAMKPQAEIQKANAFGTVSWHAAIDEATGQGKVILKVEVLAMSAGPENWTEFKNFLSWIEEACRHQVTLSKVG